MQIFPLSTSPSALARLTAPLCGLALIACASTPPAPPAEAAPAGAQPAAGSGAATPAPAPAGPDTVHGDMFILTGSSTAPDGAWCWFEGERAIIDDHDPDNPLLLAGTVSSARRADPAENGDVDVLWRNLATGEQGDVELIQGGTGERGHTNPDHFQPADDHNTASLSVRPDGRYLAIYTGHSWDDVTRWRVSENPHDPTSWGPQRHLKNQITTAKGATYNNAYFLPHDNDGAGRYYNFTRSRNFDPTVQTSDDGGDTWAEAGKLVTQGGGGFRPYARYDADDRRIHFTITENHPRNFDNSVYHGYVQDGKLHNSTGDVVDDSVLSFDGPSVAVDALTAVVPTGTELNGSRLIRGWTADITVGPDGHPVAVSSFQVDDGDGVQGEAKHNPASDWKDHRFVYSRFDGERWHNHELAKAGGTIYGPPASGKNVDQSEKDYTGLVALVPHRPDVLFMSTDIDPRSGEDTDHYEIYRGQTADGGATWAWSAITENSTMNNVRPVVPEWDERTVVLWMRGTYTWFGDFTTQLVGVVRDAP